MGGGAGRGGGGSQTGAALQTSACAPRRAAVYRHVRSLAPRLLTGTVALEGWRDLAQLWEDRETRHGLPAQRTPSTAHSLRPWWLQLPSLPGGMTSSPFHLCIMSVFCIFSRGWGSLSNQETLRNRRPSCSARPVRLWWGESESPCWSLPEMGQCRSPVPAPQGGPTIRVAGEHFLDGTWSVPSLLLQQLPGCSC